jgi:tRNA (guanine-N7-)-methyltransferase
LGVSPDKYAVTEDDDERDREHELRSFGRRRGRKLSPRQDRLMHELLPRVAVDLKTPFSVPALEAGSPEENRRRQSAWLEIGFGGAEHLLWQAEHNPSVTLIGCEPFEDGVVKALTRIEEANLTNIRLHMGDARDVLRWLPEASISRAFILFPDPWPKRKHRKRRLVNPSTLALLARVVKPGGELRIGTDIGDYARTMLQAFRAQTAFRWQAESPADWRIRPADWAETRYEQKAEREGRQRYYFRFLRV